MREILYLLFLSIFLLVPPTESRTNQEPINIGFVFSLPWDVSNTLRAPVAGPLSIVLTACMALITFAGLAFAPVWWVFGWPKRWYNMHTAPDSPEPTPSARHFFGGNYSLEDYPDFTSSIFLFLPQHKIEQECKKLIVCHSHGFLNFFPERILRIYRFFSKNILSISPHYKQAIQIGLHDQGKCIKKFKNCKQDVMTLVKTTLLYNMPQEIQDIFQKRKQ